MSIYVAQEVSTVCLVCLSQCALWFLENEKQATASFDLESLTWFSGKVEIWYGQDYILMWILRLFCFSLPIHAVIDPNQKPSHQKTKKHMQKISLLLWIVSTVRVIRMVCVMFNVYHFCCHWIDLIEPCWSRNAVCRSVFSPFYAKKLPSYLSILLPFCVS